MSTVKLSKDLLVFCWEGLNLGWASSASLHFFGFVHEEGSKFFFQLLIIGGGGSWLGFLLPVIVFMRLKSFLVSLPASMICEESVWVFALLIMAMYLFLLVSVLSTDVQLCITSRFTPYFWQFACAVSTHLKNTVINELLFCINT